MFIKGPHVDVDSHLLFTSSFSKPACLESVGCLPATPDEQASELAS